MENKQTEDSYPKDPVKLKEACDRYQKHLEANGLTDSFQKDFFDVDDIKAVLAENKSRHVKVYYGIDEKNRHFLFLAPTQEDGRARDDVDTTGAICCCERPPCPLELSDRYAN
jgi:hypothetical protein